jgi:hypothetical protein
MMERFDRGLSGCLIQALDSNTIRKSSSKEYSKRLIKQANKQKYFSNCNLTTIDVPKVFEIGDDYFDMEYIPAETFDLFFETCDTNQINFILNSLYEYFDFLISTKKTFKECEVKTRISKKIESLEIPDSKFKDYLLTFEYDAIGVPKTFCHGDLTFSNILFNGKRVFFIDFLDSYLNSFLVDLVKLKQDLFYFWSIKVNNKRSLRLYQSKRFIWKRLYDRYEEYIDTDLFDLLDVLNLLRIQPYLTDERHKVILKNLLESTTLYEKFNYSNGREVIKIP